LRPRRIKTVDDRRKTDDGKPQRQSRWPEPLGTKTKGGDSSSPPFYYRILANYFFLAAFFAGAFFLAAAFFAGAFFFAPFFAGISYPPFHSAVAEDKKNESLQFA
jgi:hypothetical protein